MPLARRSRPDRPSSAGTGACASTVPLRSRTIHLRPCAPSGSRLRTYLPPPSGHDTPKAPHNAAYTYFYDELRVHLFHAKASRQPSLPHNAVAVAAMSERHENLTRLYLDLLNKMTGVTRTGGGGLTYAGFEMATSTLANEARIYLTNELAPFDREETEAAPPGREVAHAPAAPEPQQERPWLRAYLAAIPGADVEPLGPLTRMTLETEG